jgi:hypothetical protein
LPSALHLPPEFVAARGAVPGNPPFAQQPIHPQPLRAPPRRRHDGPGGNDCSLDSRHAPATPSCRTLIPEWTGTVRDRRRPGRYPPAGRPDSSMIHGSRILNAQFACAETPTSTFR